MRTIVAGALLGLAVLAGGGYYIGEKEAATDADAAIERRAGYRAAYSVALRSSRRSARERGVRAGEHEGQNRGHAAGRRGGTAAANTDADRRRAVEAAAAAAAAEAEVSALPTIPEGLQYTNELPHGEPGYLLPPDERSLGCVGFDAETGQCIGD